jgi:SAM-dependent MidA family methyltransferase
MIRAEGPISFDRFQAAALYDPEEGYYEKPGRVGKDGDFVTGASWHPEECGALRVVDVGAGEGELLANLAEALAGESASLVGVEASATRRALGARRLPGATWLADAAALPAGGPGLLVGYELVDALPVRTFRVAEDGSLDERLVDLDAEERFVWREAPAPDSEQLLGPLVRRGATLEPGQVVEVRPGAAVLARTLARAVGRGLLLLFDYGARTRPLYSASRPGGTLEAFLRHQVSRDVLVEPGSRDLTAWVDFGELEEALAGEGMAVRGLVSQSRVLLAGGIAQELALADPDRPLSPEESVERNAIAKLFVPGGMGESLRVLVAERGTRVGESLLHLP